MFILERLISRGSRALGVMIGTSRRGAGHAQGGREGDADDDVSVVVLSPSCSFLSSIQFGFQQLRRHHAGAFVLSFPEEGSPWIAEHF